MKKSLFIPEQKTPYFSMRSLTVTAEKDLSFLRNSLSEVDLKRFLAVHERIESDPKAARREVESLRVLYPHHPDILNLLTFLLLKRRKLRKAQELMVENYTHNPDHLLVKINYADYCIRKKWLEEIPEIFHETFDLRLLYPKRNAFHLSEYRGFVVMMGFYHLAKGEREAAESYFYLGYTVDNGHPSVQLLKKKLYRKPLYQKLFRIDRSSFC